MPAKLDFNEARLTKCYAKFGFKVRASASPKQTFIKDRLHHFPISQLKTPSKGSNKVFF